MPASQQKLRPGWTTTVFKLRLLAAAATFLFSSSKGRRTGSKAGAPVALAGSRLSDVSLLLSYSSLDPDVKVNHRYGAAVTTSTTIFVCPAPVSLRLFLLIAGAREGHRMGYRGTDETASAVHCIESIFLLFFHFCSVPALTYVPIYVIHLRRTRVCVCLRVSREQFISNA